MAPCPTACRTQRGVRCRQLHTDVRSDHVLWLTVERMEWHRLVFRGNKPAARDGHACTLYDDR